VVPVQSASASQISDKKAEADRLAAEISANGDREAALSEQYDGATYELQQAEAAISQAQQKLDTARANASSLQHQVSNIAVQLYAGGSANDTFSTFDVQSANQLAVREQYSNVSSSHDQSAIDGLAAAEQDLTTLQKALEQRRAEAAQRQKAIDSARQQVVAAQQTEQQLLSQVKGEIAVLVKQEQEREAAAARAAALARIRAAQAAQFAQTTSAGGGGSVDPSAVGGGNFPNVPPPSAGVAAVIAYARAQLGKPYQYAATGPDSFDCSGLTMMAWRQAGVYMPHYSGAQFAMFPQVSLGQLQPGDLIFLGPGGSQHVALYVGGGMQIAATHTGDYVRLQPLMSNITGAVRPG
jgi:cell wall-associated NlpC family hydrolase